MRSMHLAGNEYTEYKKAVLRLMSEAFVEDKISHVGEPGLIGVDGTRMECDLVLNPEWITRLPELMDQEHIGA